MCHVYKFSRVCVYFFYFYADGDSDFYFYLYLHFVFVCLVYIVDLGWNEIDADRNFKPGGGSGASGYLI